MLTREEDELGGRSEDKERDFAVCPIFAAASSVSQWHGMLLARLNFAFLLSLSLLLLLLLLKK